MVIIINNPIIFDTHCHLADEKYQGLDVGKIIKEAEKVGVKYILNVGYDKASNQKVIKQLKEFPNLYGALGLHPNSNEDLNDESLKWIENQLLNNKKIVAVGEIGLDYYRAFTEKKKQKFWFRRQLELAKKYDFPVLLHIREAFADAYEIVKEAGINKGILHCFTGNWETAQKFLDLGNFYLSFAGNITYQNGKWEEKWREVIEKVPRGKLVVETDSPYLAPIPERGKINFPSNIIYTLRKIAEIKKMDYEKLVTETSTNARWLFKLL